MTGAAGYGTALQREEMRGVRHLHRQGTGMHSLLLYCKVHRYYMVQYKGSSVYMQSLHGVAVDTHLSPCQRERKQNVRR